MQQFVCRFRLSDCAPIKGWDGSTQARIRFSATQSGVFGKMTPNGDLSMHIANSTVAASLIRLWADYCANPNMKVAPLFEVTFSEIPEPQE